MKAIVVIIFSILFWNTSFAQSDNFKLTYGVYSLIPLSNYIGYPLISIKNNSLTYTYRERTSKYDKIEKYDKYIDTVWVYDTLKRYVEFRQSSIDSIIEAVKQINPKRYLDHNLVFSSNPCIMDGGIIIIDIKYSKTKKVRFELGNTFDSTALQIVNIINPYLPEKHKISIPYKMWKESIDCWERERKKWKDDTIK